MSITQKTIKHRTNKQASANWKACLVTSQHKIENLLTTHLGHEKLRIKRRLGDLIGERDCNLFIIDTRIPDIKLWPAPILVDPNALHKPWLFLLSRISDASSLSWLPSNSKFFESTALGIDALISFVNKIIEPGLSKKIERIFYLESIRSFVVHMGNEKVYLVKMSDLSEADLSHVNQYRVGRNHNYFKVRQESGNWFEVPWDEILYHYEPEYEYYEGKQVQATGKDRARHIGERVREIRNTKGLSIEELAKKAGLKRPNLSRLEHGKHVPSLETLERLSIPLGVPVADIVAWPSENRQVMPPVSSRADSAKIKIIGIGRAGCNIITRMIQKQIQGVEFVAMDTDVQVLDITEAPIRIQLGEKLTRGLGVGGDHILGQKAAEENRDELKKLISEADMVLITCGMGGGTGTGSAPVVAEIAKQSGALTIAVVTKPFTFEGVHRTEVAENGIVRLLGKVDTLIIIPNDRLLDLCDQKTVVDNAFKLADDVLLHGVQTIAEVITVPGLINLDFADVKAVMKDAGPAWMSIGIGTGKNRAANAAREALNSPLLDVSIEGAKNVFFNVAGGTGLTLFEVNEAAEVIKRAVGPEDNIIFSVVQDPSMGGEVRITLIATGFTSKLGLAGVSREEEFMQLLKGLENEEELDAPAFLRRPLFSHRKQAITPSTKLAQPQVQDKTPAPTNEKSTSNTTHPNHD